MANLDKNKQIQELQNAVRLEKALETQFQALPRKTVVHVVPPEQREVPITDSSLNINLAKNNLKELGLQPGLINVIVNYLESTNEITNFNKYFTTFRKAVAGLRINSQESFKKLYESFLNERIGVQQETITPVFIDRPPKYTEQELKDMDDKQLDDVFKKYVVFITKDPSIKSKVDYINAKGDITKHDLVFKENKVGNVKQKILYYQNLNTRTNNNAAKIRYILASQDLAIERIPTSSDVGINTSSSSMPGLEMLMNAGVEGSGLYLSSPSLGIQKKKVF